MSKHTAISILSGYRNHFVYQAAIAAEMLQYKEDNK